MDTLGWVTLFFFAYIFIFIGFILFFLWAILSTLFGAPYSPTENDSVEKMLNMAKLKEGDVFVELGSGDGRAVIAAAQRGAKAIGVEIDPLRVLWSRYRIWRSGVEASIIWQSVYDYPLPDNTRVVFVYLLPFTNRKLADKLSLLPKDSVVVTNTFEIADWSPQETVDGDEGKSLYLYHIGALL